MIVNAWTLRRGPRAALAPQRAQCPSLGAPSAHLSARSVPISRRAQAGADLLELSQSVHALGANALNGGDAEPLRVTLGVLADGVQVKRAPMVSALVSV